MVVDHLGGPTCTPDGGNQFFVSAAEGFIFLSGLLVGLIYGPCVRDGLACRATSCAGPSSSTR